MNNDIESSLFLGMIFMSTWWLAAYDLMMLPYRSQMEELTNGTNNSKSDR